MTRRRLSACFVLVGVFPLSATEVTLSKLKSLGKQPKRLIYKRVGERALHVDVYEPEGRSPEQRRPAILMIHGGGWTAPGPFHFVPHCRYFALRGLVAVNVEYRLVGKKTSVRIPDCIADCRAALRFVRRSAGKLGIDPDRIAVAGDSAGGHLAAALALLPDPDEKTAQAGASARPNAIVLYNPCLDLVALKWMKIHAGVAGLPDTPKEESWAQHARRVSPMQHVGPGAPPTLLIHGARDECVPVEQADRFAKQMGSAGNRVIYHRMKNWKHAFVIPNYGTEEQIVKSLRLTDAFLASLGYLEGEPTIATEWRPPAYKELFTEAERQRPHVVGRSFPLDDWPFLDGQWEGILCASDGNVYFSASSHDRTKHAQVFRYRADLDQVQHLADVGEVCGETDLKIPTQDKIHSQMFEDDGVIYCGTCEGHAGNDPPYQGGYWIAIDQKTGRVRSLGKSISKDGLICVGYDRTHKRLYGHTNRRGRLLVFDPATREERDLGFPWEGAGAAWPRGLTLMVTEDGRVYGARPPSCSFWEYDPRTGKMRTLDVAMPPPKEVAAGDKAAIDHYRKTAAHITLWNERDQCFYFVRSFDEALCRFYPPSQGKKARVEVLRILRPDLPRRYGNRLAACTLVIHDRTVYYTPYTGWGGETHLVSYHLDRKTYRHHGPIIVEGNRRVNECHSMDVAADGKLYLVAFVFTIKGKDPERPNAMRDKYPFHPRLVVIDP